jgi:hypothetical protein
VINDHLALLLIAFLVAPWTVICLLIGFRMGRRSIDKPLPPFIEKKQARIIDEDPFWEPMNGTPQPSYPTAER